MCRSVEKSPCYVNVPQGLETFASPLGSQFVLFPKEFFQPDYF